MEPKSLCEALLAVAASAEEALNLLLTFKPDVIVSDIGMPEKDRYEFIRRRTKARFNDPDGSPQRIRSGRRPHPLGSTGYQTHLAKPVERQNC
jgi:CheY-like chemotaxis protein